MKELETTEELIQELATKMKKRKNAVREIFSKLYYALEPAFEATTILCQGCKYCKELEAQRQGEKGIVLGGLSFTNGGCKSPTIFLSNYEILKAQKDEDKLIWKVCEKNICYAGVKNELGRLQEALKEKIKTVEETTIKK